MSLSSMPGISGDEGWWGVQALAWLSNRPTRRTRPAAILQTVFLIPLALLHTIASPSFWTLRAITALVNLLALPLGFWFADGCSAIPPRGFYTVALAIMPTAIAHSRIAQDPSQSIFWTSIVIYLCLLSLEARQACLALPWRCASRSFRSLSGRIQRMSSSLHSWSSPVSPLFGRCCRHRAEGDRLVDDVLVAGLLVAWSAFRLLAWWNEYLDRPWLSMASSRLTDGGQWLEFAVNNARLFNGVTIYHYFSGARPATAPFDVGVVILVVAAFWGFLRRRLPGAPCWTTD